MSIFNQNPMSIIDPETTDDYFGRLNAAQVEMRETVKDIITIAKYNNTSNHTINTILSTAVVSILRKNASFGLDVLKDLLSTAIASNIDIFYNDELSQWKVINEDDDETDIIDVDYFNNIPDRITSIFDACVLCFTNDKADQQQHLAMLSKHIQDNQAFWIKEAQDICLFCDEVGW